MFYLQWYPGNLNLKINVKDNVVSPRFESVKFSIVYAARNSFVNHIYSETKIEND